jgi:hypothetical protein
MLALVNVKKITGPAIAVDDHDQDLPHTWLCLAGRDKWAKILQYILQEEVTQERAMYVLNKMEANELVDVEERNS